jgi:hypothetical protein
MATEPFDVFAIVSEVLKAKDGLCMDTEAERNELAAAIWEALHDSDVLAQWAL